MTRIEMKFSAVSFFATILFLVTFNISDTESKRNYRHTDQELKLIKNVVLDQQKCGKNVMPIVIHSAAHSSGKYFDRRQASRNTWVKEAKEHEMRPLFFIGLPADERTQQELQIEAKQFNDIIQFGFIDNYYNLTLKALSILRWIRKNCLTSDYVLKTDDDVLVNVPLLDTMIKEKKFADGLTGKMLTTRSNRRFGHKWFMPPDIYEYRFYRFLYGFSYVMSKNSVKRMYKKASNFSHPVLDIDDLFMTGVLAGKARVLIFNDNKFDYYCGTEECLMQTMVAMHGCPDVNQTLLIWDHWKSSELSDCRNNTDFFEYDFMKFKLSLNLKL